MIRKSRKLGALAVTAAAALLLVGCSSSTPTATPTAAPSSSNSSLSSAESAQIQTLYAAARKEGPVVFYCFFVQVDCNKMAADYEAAFPGVQIQAVQNVSGTISSRYAAEKAAGAPTADVLSSSDYAFLQDMLAKGWTTPLNKDGIPGMSGWPAQWWSDAVGSPIGAKGYPIGYNTDLVKGKNIPKTISDLLNPKWKGKIIGPQANATVGQLAGYAVFVNDKKAFGDNMLKIVKNQGLRYVNGGMAPAAALLGAGEASIQFPGSADTFQSLMATGAPINYVFPKVTAGNPIAWGINSKPAHPAGAKLLIYFLTSQQEELSLWTSPAVGIEDRWLKPDFTVIPTDPAFFEDKSAQQKMASLLGLSLQ
jgi:iron(III) transport system substrate-binding protein